jgi:hypothetical protein
LGFCRAMVRLVPVGTWHAVVAEPPARRLPRAVPAAKVQPGTVPSVGVPEGLAVGVGVGEGPVAEGVVEKEAVGVMEGEAPGLRLGVEVAEREGLVEGVAPGVEEGAAEAEVVVLAVAPKNSCTSVSPVQLRAALVLGQVTMLQQGTVVQGMSSCTTLAAVTATWRNAVRSVKAVLRGLRLQEAPAVK